MIKHMSLLFLFFLTGLTAPIDAASSKTRRSKQSNSSLKNRKARQKESNNSSRDKNTDSAYYGPLAGSIIEFIAGYASRGQSTQPESQTSTLPDLLTPEDTETETEIGKMSIETLRTKYKKLKTTNLDLQKKVMKLVAPASDKSDLPTMEDIRQDFDKLRKQTANNLFNDLTDEITDQFGSADDEVVDRAAREVLFVSLLATYHRIRKFKRDKYEGVFNDFASIFDIKKAEEKEKLQETMYMVTRPYFQNHYKKFSKHQFMQGVKEKDNDMDAVIDEIYEAVKAHYPDYGFWKKKSYEKRIKKYIGQTCELCWIMVLNTPQLYFYPPVFSKEDGDTSKKLHDELAEQMDPEKNTDRSRSKKKKKKKGPYRVKEEQEMDAIVKQHKDNPFDCTTFDDKFHEIFNVGVDDEDEEGAGAPSDYNGKKIAYCGWPSLVRKPLLTSEKHTQITKTFAYTSDNPSEFMRQGLV